MLEFDASEGGIDLSWNRWLRMLAVLALLLVFPAAADAKIIYVNVANSTSGNGSSWSKAFTYLQDALGVAIPGDKIYLAAGTYYPDDFYVPPGKTNDNYGDRELSFELDQVTLYGGFVGTETSINQRNPEVNETVLSGEIWPVTEDPLTMNFERYWSLHVVVLKGSSILDGVTIERGRANGDEAPYNQGGGVYAPSGTTLTLVDCALSENLAAESGGAVWGNVIATNCTFSDNLVNNEFLLSENKEKHLWLFSPDCKGGAINGDVKAVDCQFLDNQVKTRSLEVGITTSATGGAIAGTTITLKGCGFKGNAATATSWYQWHTGSDATSYGGAISGNVTASSCTFENNVAEATSYADKSDDPKKPAPFTAKPTSEGGAIIGEISAVNCAFYRNECNSRALRGDNAVCISHGGAVHAKGESQLVNCTFTENNSLGDIGAAVVSNADDFYSRFGGAVYAATDSLPLMNSTFLDNGTNGNGSALCCNGNVNILSNIFWYTVDSVGELGSRLYLDEPIHVTGKARISNRLYPTPSTETINILKGGITNVTRDGGSYVDFGEPPDRTLLNPEPPATPGFANIANPSGPDGVWGTPDDGLRLTSDSPAIGRGHPLFIPKDILDIDEDGNVTESVPIDVAGYKRIQDGTLDLGAYEFGNELSLPEISVEQSNGLVLTDGVSAVDMGATPGTSVTKTFLIKNKGIGSLNKLAVTMSGANVGDFSFTQPAKTSVPQNGNTSFTVTFTPTVTGPRSVSVHIASNDLDEDPFDFDIQGDTIVPDIALEQPVGTGLTDNVSVIDYGSVWALSSVSKTFTIRNNGQAKLEILGISSTGTNAKEFTVSALGNTVVLPGGTTTFKVAFAPSKAGSRSASITIQSNDPDEESFFTIAVKGNGVSAPEIAVKQPSSTDLVDGGTKSFGSVKTGLSYTKTFTIKNVGSSKLKNLAVSLSGARAFRMSKLSKTSLLPGTKTTFTVTFKPTSVGAKSAILRIASNDADENPFEINLEGAGYSGGASAAASALAAVSASSSTAPAGDRPRAGSAGGVVSVMKGSDGLEYLMLTVPKTTDWGAAKHTAEVSPNLVDWFSGDKHTTTLLDDATVLRVRDNTPVQKGEKRYIRLK